jgi:hypothetical protein
MALFATLVDLIYHTWHLFYELIVAMNKKDNFTQNIPINYIECHLQTTN